MGCRGARRRGKAITARWMGRGRRRLLIIIVVSGGREGCVKGSCQSGRRLDPASITTDKKSWVERISFSNPFATYKGGMEGRAGQSTRCNYEVAGFLINPKSMYFVSSGMSGSSLSCGWARRPGGV